MSLLARSLANSLHLDDHADNGHNPQHDDVDNENDVASSTNHELLPMKRNEDESNSSTKQIETSNFIHEIEDEELNSPHTRGVKEDLNELKQTLTRQIWDVASFLAPPPPRPPPLTEPFNVLVVSNGVRRMEIFADRSGDCTEEEEAEPWEIGHDFSEIGERFRSGVSKISKMAGNHLESGPEENEGSGTESEMEKEEFYDWKAAAVGITDEVLTFAMNIAMHPETWLDFPLDEEDDLDDFKMSDAQRAHALAIEQLAPRLAALRFELCPCHMSEGYFWKVYYVLLHSRLNKQDADILYTPQVIEARALWMQELNKNTKPESDWFGTSTSYSRESCIQSHEDYGYSQTFHYDQTTSSTGDYSDKYPDASTEIEFFDKSVILEKPMLRIEKTHDVLVGSPLKIQIPEFEDDDDDWPDEEDSDLGCFQSTILAGNEEDISFSDLEDDGDISTMKSKMLLKSDQNSALENL